MLNLTACRIVRSDEMPFDPAANLAALVVGIPLVQGATIGTVKAGTGGAGEKFVGVSLAQPTTLQNFPKVEYLTANASAVSTLFRTPIAGSLRVVADESGSALTAGNPGSVATEYSISGATVTFHTSRAAKTARFFYQYVPNTLDARVLQGDTQPGGAASLSTGSVGVVRAGLVYTSEWDTTVDWNTANPDVRVGLVGPGRFTIGGSGAVVPQAQVHAVPSTSDSLLGIYFSA